jgi:hypothetical protein
VKLYHFDLASNQCCGSETFCYGSGSRSNFSKSYRSGSDFQKVPDPVSDPTLNIYSFSRTITLRSFNSISKHNFQRIGTLRDPVTRFSPSGFFHQTTPFGPLTHRLKLFCIWLRIRGDIDYEIDFFVVSGVNDTAGHWSVVSMTPLTTKKSIS